MMFETLKPVYQAAYKEAKKRIDNGTFGKSSCQQFEFVSDLLTSDEREAANLFDICNLYVEACQVDLDLPMWEREEGLQLRYGWGACHSAWAQVPLRDI